MPRTLGARLIAWSVLIGAFVVFAYLAGSGESWAGIATAVTAVAMFALLITQVRRA